MAFEQLMADAAIKKGKDEKKDSKKAKKSDDSSSSSHHPHNHGYQPGQGHGHHTYEPAPI